MIDYTRFIIILKTDATTKILKIINIMAVMESQSVTNGLMIIWHSKLGLMIMAMMTMPKVCNVLLIELMLMEIMNHLIVDG
mgnify:CR=1 FL=1